MDFRRIVGGSHPHGFDPGLEFLEERVVYLLVHDGSRAGRAFLPLVAECGNGDTLDSFVQVGIGIHDNRVLAAHLCDHALDPALSFLMPGRQFVDTQPHIARSGESDEASLGMLHQQVADGRSASGEQAE
jgi:hypothetical protein